MRFASGYLLFALLLLPLIWWRWFQRRPFAALRFSSLAPLQRQQRGFGVRARHVVPALRTLAVALLIVCLARPEKGNEQTRIYAEGIAIQMVVDLSGSMESNLESRGLRSRGERFSRLDAVKRIFREFVEGDGEDLGGRPDDLIGLIGFARYADSHAPLTLDHENVLRILDDAETVAGPSAQRRAGELNRLMEVARARGDRERMEQIAAEYQALEAENQTAIGDAIALAVERLRDLDRQYAQRAARGAEAGDRQVKSKVMILLTDGHNNAGALTPLQAGELARAAGIKVYAVGLDTLQQGSGVDAGQMRRIAESTGGKYFLATNTRALHDVYAEIDELEKTRTEEQRYLSWRQMATSPVTVAGLRLPPLLLLVLAFLVLEVLLSNTRFRRIP